MIIKKNPEKKLLLTLLIASVAFIFSGIDSLEQNNIILAVSNFLLAAVNISAIYFSKLYYGFVKTILLILNSILFFIIAYSYFTVGKSALPTAWLIAGILYLVAAFISYKSQKVIPKV